MNGKSLRELLWPEAGVWAALMVLLATTLGSAYVPLGLGNGLLNYAIAILKALLVVTLFMHLRHASALTRLAATAGLFWLAALFIFSFSDYLTR